MWSLFNERLRESGISEQPLSEEFLSTMIWDKLKDLKQLINVLLQGQRQRQSLISFSDNIYGQSPYLCSVCFLSNMTTKDFRFFTLSQDFCVGTFWPSIGSNRVATHSDRTVPPTPLSGAVGTKRRPSHASLLGSHTWALHQCYMRRG